MNKLHIAILCFAWAALMSCSDNLFGSSSAGSCGKDIKCLRLEAENEFRSGNYEKAYNIYKEITEKDTTASVGYFGMAQAGLWMRGINSFDIFRFTDLNNLEDGQTPFRDDSIKVQNRYYQGMTLAYNALFELNRRDSLTVLYELHKKYPLDQANSILDTTLRNNLYSFRDKYGPSYEEKKFLSDREYKYAAYRSGLLISKLATTMLSPFDTNSDGCITKGPNNGGLDTLDYPPGGLSDTTWWVGKEWNCDCKPNNIYNIIKKNCRYDYDQSLALNPDGTIDTEQILKDLNVNYDSLLNDTLLPPKIGDINDKIDDFIGNLGEVMNMLGGEEGDWQAEINKYNDYASFYKVGTRLDEDGDGCFDEELLNKLDNDGDGIIGEDARLAAIERSSPIWGQLGLNHVMMYNENPTDPKNLPMLLPPNAKKYICNEPEPNCPNKRTNLRSNDEGDTIVIGFTQEPGYWTTDSLELKLKVAQDTECGNLKYGLEKRKELVGGCWLFYNEEQFKRIWLNRHANNCCDRIPNCAAEKIQVVQKKLKSGS